MSFVSWQFLAFLAVFMMLYFLSGRYASRWQWLVLLLASYVFYMALTPWTVIFLILSTVTTWSFSILLEKEEEKLKIALHYNLKDLTKEEKKILKKKTADRKRLWLVLCIVCNLGVLASLKYTNFVRDIFHFSRISFLVLPLGISFYTFQSLGYCIDVYRGMASAEKNFLKYTLFVSYFPQISQGPIGSYQDLSPQLVAVHTWDGHRFKLGIERILLGYFKKLVIANNLALFIDPVYADPAHYSGIVLLFATFLYAFQLYADFSGYMDIVCGVSSCLGIQLAENFETPYFSSSIAEFWRRWHISLGVWFRNYLYYPLMRSGGISSLSKFFRNRGGKKAAQKIPVILTLFITWFVIGLWHGADVTFILYGLYHGFFIMLSVALEEHYKSIREKLHISELSPGWRFFQVLRTFATVCAGYILFRAESLSSVGLILHRVFSAFYYDGWSVGLISESFDFFYWFFMFLLLAFCFFLELVERKTRFSAWLDQQILPVRWGILYIMMAAVLCMILFTNVREAASGNFIYYNF